MSAKYAFIINPNSGGGKGSKFAKLIQQEIKKYSVIAEFYFTSAKGDAVEIVKSLPAGFSHIIAVGGDGTINEVVNGILNSTHNVIFGVIPCGTGNDFIKMIGMDKNPAVALTQIMSNNLMMVDVGLVETENRSRYFINGMGTGFDAVAAEKANNHKGMGILAYLYAVITTLFTYKEPKVKLTMNNESIDIPIFLANFGNGYCAGGMFQLSPGALLDDGLFHITFISGVKKSRVFKVLPMVIKGEHVNEPEVQVFVSNHAEIFSETGLCIHTDGEIIDTKATRIQVSLLPQKISVVRQ